MKNKQKTKEELLRKIKELEEKLTARIENGKRSRILTSVFEQSSEGIAAIDLEGTILYINRAFAEIHGYTREELRGKNISIFHTPEQRKQVLEINDKLVEEEVFDGEVWHLHRNGTVFPTLMRNSLLRDENGTIIGMIGTIRDITDLKHAEKDLRESEARYKALYSMVRLMCDNVPDLIWAKDLEKKYIFTNKAMCNVLLQARTTDEPIGKTDIFFAKRQRESHPDNPDWHTFGEICADSDDLVINSREPRRFDEYGNVKGEFLFLDVYKAPFRDENGKMIGTVGSARIVTREKEMEGRRRRAEAQLKDSLREKEILLREIYHRVKNNLQVISSLLKLQAAGIEDEKLREEFREIQGRIRAMSLIHDKLSHTGDLARIDFGNYLKSFIRHLLASRMIGSPQVKISLDIEDIAFDINTAIPCGLIINELVSNSFKHAFPRSFNGKDALIRIKLREKSDGMIEMLISDNGTGLPRGSDFREAGTLGLQLVSMLTEQLRGQIELIKGEGTVYKIVFPYDNEYGRKDS